MNPIKVHEMLDRLSKTYREEAVRWVQYHSECDMIPGVHIDFSTKDLENYLAYRSSTTKGLDQVVTKLKKMGSLCNFILCRNRS